MLYVVILSAEAPILGLGTSKFLVRVCFQFKFQPSGFCSTKLFTLVIYTHTQI